MATRTTPASSTSATRGHDYDVESWTVRTGPDRDRLGTVREVLLDEQGHPCYLEVELADAERLLAKAQTELDQIPYRIEAAEAKWSYARRNLEGKQAARRSIAERVLQQAESDHAEAQATLHEWRQRQPNLRREVAALQKKVDALQQRLALLVEETRQLEEAEADVVAAEAFRDEAAARLRQAELRLERSVIRAPIAGRVLRLIAPPGSRVMGLDSQAEHRSSTVIEMYDPQRLQVRADVRLEDVPLVRSGQPVEIETASAEAAMQGRVLQSTSSANVQKNTLEVKIAVRDPPPTVRPEMLVTATFLATPTAAEPAAESSGRERLFVPRQLIQSAGSESFVWTVGPDHRVRRTPIVRGNAVQGGLVEVREGLQLTDKLIASGSDGIQPGMQVEIRGEDAALGIEGA